jgi:hypothetical protein
MGKKTSRESKWRASRDCLGESVRNTPGANPAPTGLVKAGADRLQE